MTDTKSLLVVMPAYNAEQTINHAINSIRKQTHKNFRLIVVDDCSTDQTYNIALKHTKDRRVLVYRNNKNMGAYYSRNAGLYYAQKRQWDYFTTHDADDVSNPDRYERMLRLFRKPVILAAQDRWDRITWPDGELIKTEMTMAHAIFRRVVFKKLGYFHENRFGADWEYWQRLKMYQQQTKTRSVHLEETGGYQWVHDNNLTVLVPLKGEERKRYVAKMRREIQRMVKNGSLYRDIDTELIRKVTTK
jgi:glycosyltransferase involved in cell wall biosynthesis